MPGYKQAYTLYDSAEFTIGAQTNYDVSAQMSGLCLNPQFVSIRTDASMTVRFNSTTNPDITVNANTEFVLDNFQFHSLFVTTTGSTNIKIVYLQSDPA